MPTIDIPSWQISDQICERCGKQIKADVVVWLDLRSSDNTWHIPGAEMVWNDPDNQGAFPFGATCAQHAIKNGQDW